MTLTLWSAFAALTLGTLVFLLLPLFRRGAAAPEREKYDIVVYREQLAEVEKDIERGLLTAQQADAVRAEIHHRMLALEDAELLSVPKDSPEVSLRTRKIVAAVVAVALPVAAGLLYHHLGAPELPGLPFAERSQGPEFALADSAREMQAELDKTPSAEGYKHLAGTLSMMKQYDLAAKAFRKAIDLGANDAVTMSELGETVVLANDGGVVAEALADFYKALKLDPKDARARFYIGLAQSQIGNLRKAVAIWRDLEREGPSDAPWMAMVKEHIEAYSKEGGFDPATIEPFAPSAESPHGGVSTHAPAEEPAQSKPAAARPAVPPHAKMGGTTKKPEERDAMIRAMADELAVKLEKEPGDVKGWTRLASAYRMLGEMDKALEAIGKAAAANPKDISVRLSQAEIQFAAGSGGGTLPADFIRTMREVLVLSPENVDALYYVGEAERKAGHIDVARDMWKKAISGLPADDPARADIQEQIDKLPGK